MRSWEEMKELSYVTIKLTKAKSFSEGLTKCKIAKLTRNNPVYEHVKLHQKFAKMTNCLICASTRPNTQSHTIDSSAPLPNSDGHRRACQRPKTQGALRKEKQKMGLKLLSDVGPGIAELVEKIQIETPREKAYKAANQFYETVDKFGSALKRSRSNFDKMCAHQDRIDDYFMTAIDDIDLEINQDRGLSLKEVRTDSSALKEEISQMARRRQKMQAKVQALNQPICFPLSPQQMEQIVKEDRNNKKSSNKKLNKMVSSLYEYKSCKNYSKRMKVINSIVNN